MIYAPVQFEVAMSNILGGETFTRNVTKKARTHARADRLWCEINIILFSKEKSRYNNSRLGLSESVVVIVFLFVCFYSKYMDQSMR